MQWKDCENSKLVLQENNFTPSADDKLLYEYDTFINELNYGDWI